MSIPKDVIDEIKRRIDPLDLYAEGAKLKKEGVGWKRPCPFHEEKSPSFSVAADGRFNCFGCGAKGGDVFAFIMKRDCCAFPEAARWLAERANVEIPTDTPSTPESRREWARASAERERERLRRVLTAADREEKLPDPAEVLNVWGIGAPVTSDTEVTAWLRGRGIDPAIVEALDLARAMPADVELPRWACSSSGRSYASAGYRLAVPMYDHRGVMRSIRWRALDGRSPKTMASSCKGLVMASPLAVELLAKPATEGKLGSTVILEGEPDFLRVAASDWKLEGQTPAAFGVVQGSIAREWVRRIPAGVLAIAVDDDEPGDRYAAELCTLAGYRMRSGEILAARWRAPRRGMDVGEAGGLDAGTWVFDALTSAEGTNG